MKESLKYLQNIAWYKYTMKTASSSVEVCINFIGFFFIKD